MPSELIEAQRDAMLATFRQAGISRATYLMEVANVARAAAAEGEYGPAARLYEIVGKGMGVLGGDRHLHLHGAGSGGADGMAGVGGVVGVRSVAQLTDDQLLALAQEHLATPVDVVAVRSGGEEDLGAGAGGAAVPPGDDPLFH